MNTEEMQQEITALLTAGWTSGGITIEQKAPMLQKNIGIKNITTIKTMQIWAVTGILLKVLKNLEIFSRKLSILMELSHSHNLRPNPMLTVNMSCQHLL